MCGGICLGDRANDVEVLEQNNASCRSEVWGRPIQPFHSSDGYPGLTGLQHHHHSIDVWDGDTRVFAKAPGKDTAVKNPGGWNGNDREKCSKGSWPWWQMVWVFSVPQQLSLDITWPHWFVTRHSNKEQPQESGLLLDLAQQSQIKGHVKLLANFPCNCHVFSDLQVKEYQIFNYCITNIPFKTPTTWFISFPQTKQANSWLIFYSHFPWATKLCILN